MKVDVYPNPDPFLKKTGILTSSDEFLWILSQKKKEIIADCLTLLMKSSIDCRVNIHEPSIGCFSQKSIPGTDFTSTAQLDFKPDRVDIDVDAASKLEKKRIPTTTDDDETITYCPIPNKNGDIVYFSDNLPVGILRIARNGDYKVVY